MYVMTIAVVHPKMIMPLACRSSERQPPQDQSRYRDEDDLEEEVRALTCFAQGLKRASQVRDRRVPRAVRTAQAPRSLWDGDARLGRVSGVAMMQPADPRQGDHLAAMNGLAHAELGGVLVEREVGAGSVIVL